jgi:type IV pilus biogenesis protein CpaD/CtpE
LAVRLRQSHRRHCALAALAALVALVLAGCAAGSPQTGAKTFLSEHSGAAANIAKSTKQLQLEVSRLSSAPSASQLSVLARTAAEAHRGLIAASEWSVAGQGEEGAEEEDVPRAETQVIEGATELAAAVALLSAHPGAPRASALAGYRSKLAPGRGEWDEGISQLWYLAHASHPPTL